MNEPSKIQFCCKNKKKQVLNHNWSQLIYFLMAFCIDLSPHSAPILYPRNNTAVYLYLIFISVFIPALLGSPALEFLWCGSWCCGGILLDIGCQRGIQDVGEFQSFATVLETLGLFLFSVGNAVWKICL